MNSVSHALSSPNPTERRESLLVSLRSMNASQRREFSKARTADLDRARDVELSALREKQIAALDEHRTGVAEVEAVIAAREAEIDAEIGAEVKAKLYPLAKAFGDSPRATAPQIAAVWCELSTKLAYETGKDLDARHLALAFVAAIGDPNIGGCQRFWDEFMRASDQAYRVGAGASILGGAAKACVAHANVVSVASALGALETAVAEAMTKATHPSAMMLAARQSFASHVRVGEAVTRTTSSRDYKIEVRGGVTPEDDVRGQDEAKSNVISRMLKAVTPRGRIHASEKAKALGINVPPAPANDDEPGSNDDDESEHEDDAFGLGSIQLDDPKLPA